jgi:protein-S-isoprenylcysteine O-methyltransferase Ste14
VVVSAGWFAVTAGVGAILVPWWLTGFGSNDPPLWSQVFGAVLIVAGTAAAVHVFTQFVRADGTPMPGEMTQRLVLTGLNRHVRNPIYLAAVAIFLGEAMLLGRWSLVIYAALVWIGAAAFVHWYEEPVLLRRFGAEYEDYRRAVPAWRPRVRGWAPPRRDTPGS